MLPLIIGAGVLAYAGVKFKKHYDKTKEENSWWVENSKDVVSQMVSDKMDSFYNKIEDFEDRAEKIFDKVEAFLGEDSKADGDCEEQFKEDERTKEAFAKFNAFFEENEDLEKTEKDSVETELSKTNEELNETLKDKE
ncbi:hypothetical protein ACLMNI_000444 [Campylobacter upsaliensis]|uniref:Uncharacterized protein n=1 Tax=Campylobacter upsaliensis TaxID=28080 RepID=A0A3S4SU90_CAMUP|nr:MULTISPECIES: hypothetical protein [Campylobacter]MCA5589290.1 hypothetical protein [Campylobacter upsaliensis]MDL0109455.1 hypothetical protein [Campylobacter felis]MDL0114963.1 hypothetical protein [Campylobacter felis]VEG85543.1 Uncharacterised protein [Campylobacter upsaliensis]